MGEKRGRKSLNRGKLILSGTKKTEYDYWRNHKDALGFALDDSKGVNAQPGGNYLRTKLFLRGKFSHVKVFTLPGLQKALDEEYPIQSDYNGFKLQRWGNGSYWSLTGELAIKPLWIKINRFDYCNIFYS